MSRNRGQDRALERGRTHWCEPCAKHSYLTRKAARRAARIIHPDDSKLQAYRCPVGDLWHFGHRPRAWA